MMNNRKEDAEIDQLCDEIIQLLKRVNYVRHAEESNIINMMIQGFEQYKVVSARQNVKLFIENINHLMGFEIDPAFTAEEKLIISASLQKLESHKIQSQLDKNTNSVFDNNSSSLQIEAESLKFSPDEINQLAKAWSQVNAKLFEEEQRQNEEINQELGITKVKPPAVKSRADHIQEMKAKVAIGNKALKAKLEKQSLFKRKPVVSPRSIDESIDKDMKRKRK